MPTQLARNHAVRGHPLSGPGVWIPGMPCARRLNSTTATAVATTLTAENFAASSPRRRSRAPMARRLASG